MATINASQDYDFISTLTFASASGNCKIRLYRGNRFFGYTGTVYYRTGTSGAWTTLSVSGLNTTFPVGSTTMQVANDWNKTGNDYMTQAFRDENTNLTEIAISQKATVAGTIGNAFIYAFVTSCEALITLDVPDISSATSVGIDFMQFYALNCTALTSLGIPDTSSITSVSSDFMDSYAQGCSSLERLELPAAGWFASNNVDWEVPSGRLNTVKGYVQNNTDKSDWQDLVVSGETLHTNYIRSTDDVIFGSGFNPAFGHRRLLI
jgi:hypothetical protein